ncbi:unnamed protein product [Urochloa humidicola]
MASAAAAQPDLPVALLEEILLRLDDTADLIRASAACASFRRLISDDRFLCRFRSLHRPPILGLLAGSYYKSKSQSGISFYPAKSPHSSTPAARALTQVADFSVTSLPNPSDYWRVRDVRNVRVLLSRRMFYFEYLVVYDPLHCRQVQIPPIPYYLLADVGHGGDWRREEFDPFLVPADVTNEDDLSFQVMCNVLSEHKVETFHYSSVTREWCGVASSSIASYKSMQFPYRVQRSYARGCFYWVDYSKTVMLMLDMREMKFSIVDDLPAGSKPGERAIVEVMEDRVGLLILKGYTLELYSKTLPDIGIGAKDWRHDHTIRLLDDYQWFLAGGVVEGYALMYGIRRDEFQIWISDLMKEKPNAHYFTVDLETFLIEELCVLKLDERPHFLYASFPPPFATPSI